MKKKFMDYHWKASVCWSMIYLISLLPIFLPWFYFEKDIDGAKTGVLFLKNGFSCLVFLLTIISIWGAEFIRNGEFVVFGFLCIHPFTYLYWFCFWYGETIAKFRWTISVDTAHFGFYVSLLVSLLVCIGYAYFGIVVKRKGKDYK